MNATRPLSLNLHPKHDASNRERRANKHYTEGPESPIVVDLFVEELGNSRSAECASDHRGVVDAEDYHAVSECGHVGNHDINHILELAVSALSIAKGYRKWLARTYNQSDVADPIQCLRGKVSLNVWAGRFHDQADNR